MSDASVNLNRLNSLKSKTKITLSDVSGSEELKKIFKSCDTEKPVDVLETNKELQSWRTSLDNLSQKSDEKPKYKVKSGDTVVRIVKNLGYTGIDAKKYEQALTVQLKQDGSFINDKNWLMEGATIRLLSDAKLKELGIKKPTGDSEPTKNTSNSGNSDSFTYLVQKGDTLPKIIKSLGYTGEDAKKYERALDEQLSANGSYMNDKKWLRAGSKIQLLSNSKIQELGLGRNNSSDNSIPSSSSDSVPRTESPDSASVKRTERPDSASVAKKPNKAVLPDSPKTSETSGVEDNTGLDNSIVAPKSQPKTTIPKNSVSLIQSSIKANGQGSKIVDVNSLTPAQKGVYEKYKSAYPIEPTIIKNTSTGDMHLFFEASNTQNGKNLGQQSVEIIFKKNETITNRYYTNGKVVQDKDWQVVKSGKTVQKHTAKILNQPVTKPKTKKIIDDPVQITNLKIDPSVLSGATPEQKKDLTDFMKSLMSNKAKLMKDLNLDNDAYNNFVKLAIGIAIQESGMDKGLSKKRQFKNSGIAQAGLDTLRVANIGINKVFGTKNSTATSKGLTQIKIGDWNDDPKIDKMFKKYGITSDGYYNNINANQSAIATIIVLNDLANKVKNNQDIKNGIEASKDRYYITNSIRENGEVKTNSKGYMRVNQGITDNDAIMYLYNGRTGSLKNGDMTPKDNVYTHNVRRYMDAVTLKENPAQLATAMKKARTVTEGQNTKRTKMNNDLGWGMGQVAFGSNLYTGGISKNTATEIDNLKTTLLQKGINPATVNALVSGVTNGSIVFVNKLSNEELNSITEADAELLLKYSNKLSTQLKDVTSSAKKREIASKIDRAFKQEYLANHAQQTYMSDVKGKTLKLATTNKNLITGFHNTGAQQRCNKYLKQLRGEHKADAGLWLYGDRVSSGKYTGFCVEKDKGINTTNASAMDILLAKNGADAANTLRTSGACLTGVKQALIGSGAVSVEEMSTFSNAFELTNFFAKHPDRFTEITHVQISDTVAREITAGDLSSLPAGCIVIFGNKNRNDVEGHAAITSGNGQMYADEVDNSNWDNFVATKAKQNGKGEHGYFRIFKLNPEYFTVKDNKLIKK